VKKVRLEFAPGLEVEFTDRGRAVEQVYELAEKGTRLPVVVFGPEGCGKTAWLIQAVEVLKDLGYGVVYFNPLRKRFEAEVGVEDLRRKALEVVREASSELALAKMVWRVVDLALEALRLGRRRLAVVVDDVFHLIGARESSLLVKGLLELIEYTPASYESLVVIAATSEGFSRREIGKHMWASLKVMWNMPREGFEELYHRIPNPKLSPDNAWRLTGGNPRGLSLLHQAGWDVDRVVEELAASRGVDARFAARWRPWLEKAIEDPDALWNPETPAELVEELVSRNLIVYHLYARDLWFWIDEPPPQKDLEVGIGRYVAWQTPLHREAVKRALKVF